MADIEFKGLEEMQKAYEEVLANAPDRIEKKANKILNKAKKETQAKTPVLTGNLKKGFRLQRVKRVGKSFEGKIYNNAPHAHLIEKGHRIVRPKGVTHGWKEGTHMLERTTDEVNSNISSELEKWLPEALKELEKQ